MSLKFASFKLWGLDLTSRGLYYPITSVRCEQLFEVNCHVGQLKQLCQVCKACNPNPCYYPPDASQTYLFSQPLHRQQQWMCGTEICAQLLRDSGELGIPSHLKWSRLLASCCGTCSCTLGARRNATSIHVRWFHCFSFWTDIQESPLRCNVLILIIF